MPAQRDAYLAATGALLIWAGFVPVSRLAGTGALTAWDVTALRFGTAAVLLLPLLWWRGAAFLFTPRMLALALCGGIGYALFVYSAFTLAPATHAAILLPGVLPFWTALMAWLVLRDVPDRDRTLGLGFIAAGVACMAFEQLRGSPVSPLGDALFLCGSLSWAVYTVLLRRWQVPAWDATAGVALLSALLYLPLWAWLLPSRLDAAPAGEVALQSLYQGVLVVIVAMVLFVRAQAALGPLRLNMFMAMVPVLATLLSVPLLGEPLSAWPLLGLLCVSVGALQPWRLLRR